MIENIITGVVLTSICVLGILGNSVTLMVLNSNHQMRNQPINIYLTVLALFDNGVLFNAILMLGIPGIYKLMHEPSAAYSIPEQPEQAFPGDETTITGRSAVFHPDLSQALATMSAVSTANFSAGTEPSPKVSLSSSSISTYFPLSSASPSLVASAAAQYPASHTVLRTFPPVLQQAPSNPSLSAQKLSFPPSSSASSRLSLLSSPLPPLLQRSSQLSSASPSAPLTSRWRSGRRRRRSTIRETDPSRRFTFHPLHSASAPTSSQDERTVSVSDNPGPAVDSPAVPYHVSLPSSSAVTSSTTTAHVVIADSVESQPEKRDLRHSDSKKTDPLNETLMDEWGMFSDLVRSWGSLGREANRSEGDDTSHADIPHDWEKNLKSLSAAPLPHEYGRTRDPRTRGSLLFHDALSGQEASSIRREHGTHDPPGRKEDQGTANSRLLDESGLFAGDELIFAPPDDEMDLMSPNSSASEGPLHLYIQFVYPLALISQTGSIWTTCLITAERYFAIAHPLRALTLSTRKRATWALITMSILAVVYNLPRFAEVEIVGATEDAVVKNIIRPSELRNNRVYYWVYYICIYLAVLYIIPLTLLSVLNTKIYLAIKRANRDRSSLTQNQESEMNIATMLVFLVATFIACNLPAFIVNCLELVHNSPYFHMAMIFSNFLVCFNSSVNFVIYCTFGKKFRERLHETFCCSRGRLPRRSTPIRNRKTSIVAETLV